MKRLLLWLAIILSLGFGSKLQAIHATGVEITYACTGTPQVYKITFTYYRDCSGIGVCGGSCGNSCTRALNITGADSNCMGQNFGTFSVNLVKVSDSNSEPRCPGSKSICNNMGCVTPGTFTPGIEKYVFEGNVSLGFLPPNCCKVRISFSECCRNTNNTGSGFEQMYNEAIINRCAAANTPCNSSPVFLSDPVSVIGHGQPFVYNNEAFDPDGDSLSFAFAPALVSAGTSVTYTSPYTYNTPVPWVGLATAPFPDGIRCDPLTGDIMFTTPPGSGSPFIGIITIEVKQWRTLNALPTEVGIIRRDIQIWVIPMPQNTSPSLITYPPHSLVTNLPKLVYEACVGNQLCFTVVGKDPDYNLSASPQVSDTTYLSINSSALPPGATFSKLYVDSTRHINGPRQDSLKFCWTPTQFQVRNGPYMFSITARDKRCPNIGHVTQTFSVLVKGMPGAVITKANTSCFKWNLSYTTANPSAIVSRKWEISNTPGAFNNSNKQTFLNSGTVNNLTVSDTGKYVVRLILTGDSVCTGSGTVIIYDTLQQKVNLALTMPPIQKACLSTDTFQMATAAGSPSGGTGIWSNALNPAATSTNGLVTLKLLTNQPNAGTGWMSDNYMTYTYTDSFGCKVKDSAIVRLHATPTVNANVDKALCSTDAAYNLTNAQGATPIGGVWSGPSTSLAGSDYLFNPAGGSLFPSSNLLVYTYVHNFTGGYTCQAFDTTIIQVYTKPVTSSITGSQYPNHNTSHAYNVSNSMGSVYNWMITGGAQTAGTTTSSIVVLWGNGISGQVAVQEANAGCRGDSVTLGVTLTNTGMTESSNLQKLNVYPNPSNGLLNIEFFTPENMVEVRVIDMLGKDVVTMKEEHRGGMFNKTLDLSTLKHGIYFVRMIAGEQSATVKVTLK